MTKDRPPRPQWTGATKHVDAQAGFAIWVPSDWHRTNLAEGRLGVIFSPYANDLETCLYVEYQKLEHAALPKDANVIKKGFRLGIEQLPEVEILKFEEHVGELSGIVLLDARYTFVENGVRRKRWTRVCYRGQGQYTFIAQGVTEQEFDYWEPMFYNAMMTTEL